MSRRDASFTLLFVYVTAAVGLLLTTSFLGLRRYLRQRYLPMPPMIAFGWIRFGVGVAAFVLVGALLVPRRGQMTRVERELRYHVDYRVRQASDYAMRFGPARQRRGTPREMKHKNPVLPGILLATPNLSPVPTRRPVPAKLDRLKATTRKHTNRPQPTGQTYTAGSRCYFCWFWRFWLLGGFSANVICFYKSPGHFWPAWPGFSGISLNSVGHLKERWSSPKAGPPSKHLRFAGFQNPFLSNQYSSWPREQLVLYSFEALQAWAEEHGVEPRPDRTAREFCVEVGNRFPEITPELSQLSWLYSHAAYRRSIPGECDLEPLGRLWRFLGS